MSIPLVTREAIENGSIREDRFHEFKREVHLDDPKAKAEFVSDVVAFLNAKGGHLIIGVVADRDGRWTGYRPVHVDDEDKLRCRYLNVITDNIEPKPRDIDIHFIPVEGGVIIDIAIGEHFRTYQNTINSAVCIREDGRKSRPLSPDEICAIAKERDRGQEDVVQLIEREAVRIAEAGPTSEAPVFHLGIVPREHYLQDFEPFEPVRGHTPVIGPLLNESNFFKGCEDGAEVVSRSVSQVICGRLYVGRDWQVHAYVHRPFWFDQFEQMTVRDFENRLPQYLAEIGYFLQQEQGLRGPFWVRMEVRNILGDPRMKNFFRTNAVRSQSTMSEDLIKDAISIGNRFGRQLVQASIYGECGL